MMWRALLILACAPACDLVFKVELPPDAPPSTHDEDNDGVLDVADNCPTIANSPVAAGGPQDDLDGDGVGDACDPHPDTKGDALVTVEYFEGDFGPFWTPDADDWTVSLDSVISPPPPLAGQETHGLARQALQARGATLEMGFEVLDLGPLNEGNHLELVVNTPGDNSRCQVKEALRDGTSDLFVFASAGMGSALLMPEVTVGQKLVLRLTRDAPDDVCSLGTTKTTITNIDPDGVVVIAGVVLVDIQIRVNYLAIYAAVK